MDNGGIVVNGVFTATRSSEATSPTGEKPSIGSGGATRVGKKEEQTNRGDLSVMHHVHDGKKDGVSNGGYILVGGDGPIGKRNKTSNVGEGGFILVGGDARIGKKDGSKTMAGDGEASSGGGAILVGGDARIGKKGGSESVVGGGGVSGGVENICANLDFLKRDSSFGSGEHTNPPRRSRPSHLKGVTRPYSAEAKKIVVGGFGYNNGTGMWELKKLCLYIVWWQSNHCYRRRIRQPW